jgi:DNA-binding transcriptional ArsR family regulator
MGRPMGRTVDDAPRAIVRDLTRGAATYRIDWDVRTAFDFIFSLSGDAGRTDDLPAADRTWLAETREALPGQIRTGITDLFESELAIHAGVLLVDQPDVRTAADVVALVERLSPRDLLGALFAEEGRERGVDSLIDQALAGDTTVLDELAEQLPDYHKQGRLDLLRDPSAAWGQILDVLRAWQVPFSEIEPRVLSILERDYDDRATDRERLAPADLIETTTGGVRYLPEPGISRVILAPSYFSRPYNFLMSARDWRLFGYPVADSALGPSDALTPPLSVVRLHRALGDETRLRILKLLASRDLYLTEIAQQLDLSKPTIKHHLAQLRSAGLVTITESGTVMYYSLRRNRLDDASAELKRFLVD